MVIIGLSPHGDLLEGSPSPAGCRAWAAMPARGLSTGRAAGGRGASRAQETHVFGEPRDGGVRYVYSNVGISGWLLKES